MATNSNGAATSCQPGKLGFGGVYTNNNYIGSGEIAEFLLFDRVLSTGERLMIEGYLADKWNLSSIPEAHAFKIWPHTQFETAFKNDSPFGGRKSLDLSNGVYAEVSTGGTEDTFDGDSNFSTSLWVKGWSNDSNATLLNKRTFTNGMAMSNCGWMHLMQTSSAPAICSRRGAIPSNNSGITHWYDRSGKNNHASVLDGSPVWESAGLNSKPLFISQMM